MQPGVFVTFHARRRARERAGIGVGLVAYEVSQAVEAGRLDPVEPAWTAHGGRRPHGRVLWAWNLEETRAYLVSARRHRWVVVTVVAAATPTAVAA